MAQSDYNIQLNSDFTTQEYSPPPPGSFTEITNIGTGGSVVQSVNGQVGPTITFTGGSSGFTFNAASSTITLVSPLTTKGDLYTHNSTVGVALSVGAHANGEVLTLDSGEATGMKWAASSGGTVTSVSVVTANGFAGTVATATTTPAITLTTSLTTGSVVVASAAALSQDNANFFYDITNHRLGLGTTGPLVKLSLGTDVTAQKLALYDGSSNFYGFGIASGRIAISTANVEVVSIDSDGNIKVGGTAARSTTGGTFQLVLFNGTAPVGTLANGVSFYSAAGEARVMDAAGNSSLLSPHDHETNEWIFYSKNTVTGKVLRIDMERMMRFLNDHFEGDFIHEFTE